MQRRDSLRYSVALGVVSVLLLWSRSISVADCPALPTSDLLTADASNRMQLMVQVGKLSLTGKAATTWGYNGNLLGLAVKLNKG